MPKGDYYRGLRLGDAVRKFADHHYETKNRHISEDEYQLLIRASKALGAEQLLEAGAARLDSG